MSKRGGSKFAILGLLSWQPMSGYDIKKYVEIGLSHFWSESYGAIYPTLARLVDEGLAERCDAGVAPGGRTRHLYTLTEAGRDAFVDYLARPTTPPSVRSEFKLKLFLSWDRPTAERRRLLEEYRSQQLERLEMLAESEVILGRAVASGEVPDELEGLVSRTDSVRQIRAFLLVLRHGIRQVEARLGWCDEAAEALTDDDREVGS